MTEFLASYQGTRRTWRDTDRSAESRGVYTAMSLTGQGPEPLEVAYATANQPTTAAVRDLWKQRHGRAAAPLLVTVGYPRKNPNRALLCGPTGEDPVVVDVDHDHAERLAGAGLAEPNRHLAIRFLADALDSDQESLPGLRNKGLLATHALHSWVPQELDWEDATDRARPLLGQRDHELVRRLGYEIEDKGNHKVLRTETGTARAVAVLLESTEQPDQPSPRFANQTPVTAALTSADRENLRWVFSVRGGTVRLYSTDTSGAAGQRGRAETFVELNLPILPTDQAAYLDLLFSANALANDGTLERIRAASADYTSELSKRLRARVYDEVVPRLAVAVANHLGGTDEQSLRQHYRTALTILFRLLFVAYAEDSRLLPLHIYDDYTDHALKTRARRIADKINAGQDLGFDNPLTLKVEPTTDPGLTDLWSGCLDLFHAVDKGAPGWGIPPYNGGLFSSDPNVNPVGNIIEGLALANGEFGPALTALVVDQSQDGDIGPIDFRSLSVREFGTIYEGLLESDLALADQDLTLDANDTYVPAGFEDRVVVEVGQVYLHNASGARKSSGAYFTKPFAVDHLLDQALEPTVDEHLDRVLVTLDEGRDSDAADLLFDFRVADIAMGSGHFLTAVVDRLEARFSTFLAEHPIAGVSKELAHLRAAAQTALGDLAETVEVENTSLLRRLIARRCVYGVDVNPISVELARVSMWIHTFVPGLPLSFLNHNLAVGNSLAGVGTLSEVQEALYARTEGKGSAGFGALSITEALRGAEEPLRRLGTITDATVQDIEQARQAAADAQAAVTPAAALFDLVSASRTGEVELPDPFVDGIDLLDLPDHIAAKVEDALADLEPLHFPARFPEVFLRDRPGFDVLVGNAPWEEATVEKDAYWALRFPGLRSLQEGDKLERIDDLRRQRPDLDAAYRAELADAEALRRILVHGPYPGMGTGDPDLYKAFAWRYWHLLRHDGRVGIVLPRSALSAKGSTKWRQSLLAEGGLEHVTILTNRGGWVFDEAEHRYTIALNVLHRREGEPDLHLYGPYDNHADYAAGMASDGVRVPLEEFRSWTPTSSLPLLASEDIADVFRKMRRHRPISDLPFRYVTELHATNDKDLMEFDPDSTDDLWPIWKGESFDLWLPDSGAYYAWADPDTLAHYLHDKRSRQTRRNGVFYGFPDWWINDPDTLPIRHARILFRDISRATDSRTFRTVLAPPEVALTNKAPYLARTPDAPIADEAFLLGVLSTRVFDRQARCTVENSMNLYVVEPMCVPWPDAGHPGRARVVEVTGRLAAVDDRYTEWATQVGVPVGSVEPGEREDLLVELDALVAHLYGLDEDDLRVVYSTFHPTWDHEPFMEAVIAKVSELDFEPVEPNR